MSVSGSQSSQPPPGVIPNGSPEPDPPLQWTSYREYVEYYKDVSSEFEWACDYMAKEIPFRSANSVNAGIIDIAGDGFQCKQAWTPEELRSSLQDRPESVLLRLVIVEHLDDATAAIMDVLGLYFDIHPRFFWNHGVDSWSMHDKRRNNKKPEFLPSESYGTRPEFHFGAWDGLYGRISGLFIDGNSEISDEPSPTETAPRNKSREYNTNRGITKQCLLKVFSINHLPSPLLQDGRMPAVSYLAVVSNFEDQSMPADQEWH